MASDPCPGPEPHQHQNSCNGLRGSVFAILAPQSHSGVDSLDVIFGGVPRSGVHRQSADFYARALIERRTRRETKQASPAVRVDEVFGSPFLRSRYDVVNHVRKHERIVLEEFTRLVFWGRFEGRVDGGSGRGADVRVCNVAALQQDLLIVRYERLPHLR